MIPNGDNEDRTRDLLLARQALSQLSYTPIGSGTHLLSHAVPSVVSSAVRGLTIVFGMGTGVSPGRIGTRNLFSNVLQFRFAPIRELRSLIMPFAEWPLVPVYAVRNASISSIISTHDRSAHWFMDIHN